MKKRLYVAFIIIFMFIISFTQVVDTDDMIFFTFAHNIKNGLRPYKDLNILILPLFYYVNAFVVLFVDNLLALRIVQFIISIFSFYIIKRLFDGLMPEKDTLLVSGIFALYFSFLRCGYNEYIVIFLMLAFMYMLKLIKRGKVSNIDLLVLSTIGTLAIFSKQNTGGFAFISIIICIYILTVKFHSHKTAIFNILKSISICAALTLILFFYFYIIGCLPEMIDMCFLGIATFSQDNLSTFFVLAILLFFANLLCAIYLFCFEKRGDIRYILFAILSISTEAIIYPLANSHHILDAFFLTFIFLSVFIIIKGKTRKFYRNISKFLGVFLVLYMFVALLNGFSRDITLSNQKYTKFNLITKEQENDIILIDDYLEKNSDKKYYIITENSLFLKQNKDDFANYYDLFFNGNLGTNDPILLIKKIESNYIIVYTDKENDFFQIPKEALNYIRSLNKIDEIGKYSIYSKNIN